MRTKVLLVIGFGLVLYLLAVAGSASGSDPTYIVNTTDDLEDDGSCDPLAAGDCTLREALDEANFDGGVSTIAFNIPLTDTGYAVSGIAGTWTISLTAPLPCLGEGGTIISGTTQASFIDDGDPNPDGPEIELSGASVTGTYLLCINSADNVIHGLVINASPGYGIWIGNPVSVGNTVSGNYIGTDAAGASKLGNAWNGIYMVGGAHDNVIGGQTPGERNIISGNGRHGVEINGTGAMSNTVSGNYIGTDAAGASKLGNGWDGIMITGGAHDNFIGGQTPGQGNVISGNGWMGVDIYDGANDNNAVSGNYIGTDATGTQALGNTYHGVRIDYGGKNNTIGGDTVAERNVISANGWSGVNIAHSGTNGNTVSGNYIGTDVSGTQDLGNSDSGVAIWLGAQNNIIGQGNVISGNDGYGVDVQGSETMSNTISGNYIGTDTTGTQDLGGGQDGVCLRDGAQNNTIGGDIGEESNVISGNEWSGVRIQGAGTSGNTICGNYIGTDITGTQPLSNGVAGVAVSVDAENNTIGPDNTIAYNAWDGVAVTGSGSTGNTITQNSIHSNGHLGIDNSDGGNLELPVPVIEDASCAGISGTAPLTSEVEIFTGPDEEGKTYLGTASADGSGNWSAPGVFDLDTYVTATATDSGGNTSEFSVQATPLECRQIFLPLVMKSY